MNYYMKLLEGRAKRLSKLIKIAAPQEMICKEVILILQAAMQLDLKPWSNHGKEYIVG